ncbi:MAG: hypothetical protein J6W52_03835 [Bacteroidaceae bacterium]|nr:hypothetical protein [Bacteroidaceae bacterium]
MIKIHDDIFYPIYEYLYLFVMVIYMAQMTPDTGRMVGGLSGDPIPLLIPIVLTIILLVRNPISFAHSKLWTLVGIMLSWSIAVCYKFHDFSSSNLSYYFFLLYAIFIAFIHIRIYGRDLFPIYEHIMVVFSTVSLVLWGMSVLIPPMSGLFHLFPETAFGNNVLYLFNWMDPLKGQSYGSLIRNAGCSWEPGRFAIMLIPAIVTNLSREGILFRGNTKIIILLLALASTFSTTGYSIVFLIYTIFWLNDFSAKSILSFVFIALPFAVAIFSLDFMAEKIQDKANFEGLTRERMHNINYNAKMYGDEYLGSLDRIESAYFEWANFKKEPLIGYGRNNDHSWFRQEVTKNFALTGGLVKIFAQYGFFIGFYLYVLLFYSSIKISRTCWFRQKFAFAVALLGSSLSYPVFCIPIFTAFWFYGLFCYEEDEIAIDAEETYEEDDEYAGDFCLNENANDE